MSVPPFIYLHSERVSIVFDCRRGVPAITYFGDRLHSSVQDEMLAVLTQRQEAKCAPVEESPLSLTPTLGDGFTGHPGLTLNDNGIAWSAAFRLISVAQTTNESVHFTAVDETRQLTLEHCLSLDPHSQVLSGYSRLTNQHAHSVNLLELAAPTIALADHINQILAFEGRWSSEFQTRSIDLFLGAYSRENRRGKTSHDNFPGVILHATNTSEEHGQCFGFHLGWSGNHRTRVELLPDQRTYVQMGELLDPTEVMLAQGESYTSPTLYVSYSGHGFNQLSQQFHEHVRGHLLDARILEQPRPVHYNTWEGIYFNHSLEALVEMADLAAKAGAERFVLDDGWFKGRRHDKAGLGDWVVDKTVYPHGLQPLIDHVVQAGMAMGIWFEPEMVNPDSDLYRQHPDWVLSTAGNQQINFRHQLLLDLTRQEVFDYLFDQINAILSEYPLITYIKWDMNRDNTHSGNFNGRPAVHQQTLAVYHLIEKVKNAHPHVEIESCSSGGARIDFGILQYTDRFWTSDSNDALDRLHIQRGASFFIPPIVMGSHVGPRDCHITGRHIPIATRIAVALFGHMGMEMDPRELTDQEMQCLQQGFALHKAHRHLIHHGDYYRLESNGDSIDFGIVAKDKSEALFAYNSVIETKRTQPRKYRFIGLDPAAIYTLELVWPGSLFEYSPSILEHLNDVQYSGDVLMKLGMQLPIVFPQTSLIFQLVATQ